MDGPDPVQNEEFYKSPLANEEAENAKESLSLTAEKLYGEQSNIPEKCERLIASVDTNKVEATHKCNKNSYRHSNDATSSQHKVQQDLACGIDSKLHFSCNDSINKRPDSEKSKFSESCDPLVISEISNKDDATLHEKSAYIATSIYKEDRNSKTNIKCVTRSKELSFNCDSFDARFCIPPDIKPAVTCVKNTNLVGALCKFKCDFCSSTFSSLSRLQIHVCKHTGIKPYKCVECGSSFTEKGHLRIHNRVHTGEKPYQCEMCGSAFARTGELSLHIRTHTGFRPHKCETCGSTFTQRCHLTAHLRIHTKEKPYSCKYCDSAFAEKSKLQRHLRSHLGHKPFKCDYCSSAFTQKSTLNNHTLLHTGCKPYKCLYCNAAFTQQGAMNRHTLVHRGDRPFKCDQCNASFAQKSHLQMHGRVHD